MTRLSSKNYLNYIKIILHIIDWSRNYCFLNTDNTHRQCLLMSSRECCFVTVSLSLCTVWCSSSGSSPWLYISPRNFKTKQKYQA